MLLFEQGTSKLHARNKEPLNLTQQSDEKHIPMCIRGNKTPEVPQVSKERREPGNLEILFKFQPECRYSGLSDVSNRFDTTGNPLPKSAVSRSAPWRIYNMITA